MIPFNRPCFLGSEYVYINDAVQSGHISGDGKYTKKCSTLLEDELGVKKCLLTTSCTHALEMAAILLNIRQGDEFIVPSFTFVSTVNAFVLRGGHPVFADIRSDTLNINEKQIEELITPRVKAIIIVHYAGVPCEMKEIVEIADKHKIPVIEDNAHALFSKYMSKFTGTFGSMATLSFHETKNISCGEGGALLINNPQYIERAEIVREKGTDRSKFFRGQVDKYSWVDIGSSYLPSELLAAVLYAQLEKRVMIEEKRSIIWHRYQKSLSQWAELREIRLPFKPDWCDQSYHMFYMLMPSSAQRQSMLEYLNNNGVHATFHYLPLHLSKMGERYVSGRKDCPVTENISNRIIRLPFFTAMTESEQNIIIDVVMKYRK